MDRFLSDICTLNHLNLQFEKFSKCFCLQIFFIVRNKTALCLCDLINVNEVGFD